MKSRDKIIRADEEFALKLEQIMARRLLNGRPIKSTAKLTQEMLLSENFKKLEEELAQGNNKMQINIRFDGFFR